jgi:hypothetical protein
MVSRSATTSLTLCCSMAKPKVFAACADHPGGIYFLNVIAQDGTGLFGCFVSSRSEARWAVQKYAKYEMDKHFPDGWEYIDLTRLNNRELNAHGEYCAALGLAVEANTNATSERPAAG